MATQFDEALGLDEADPLFQQPSACEFDYGAVDPAEALPDSKDEIYQRLSDALRVVLIWMVKDLKTSRCEQDLRKRPSALDAQEAEASRNEFDRELRRLGVKALALLHTIDPGLIEGTPSLRRIGRLAGVDKTALRRFTTDWEKRLHQHQNLQGKKESGNPSERG